MDRAAEIRRRLRLEPHPEGGAYREVFRSAACVATADGRGGRSALTAIYFLLGAGEVSRWHRLASDEIWSHLDGAPVELWTAHLAPPRIEAMRLGPAEGKGGEPICVVPAGAWQAARSEGDFSLVACVVGPGFEFEDFELLRDLPNEAERLLAGHPTAAAFL